VVTWQASAVDRLGPSDSTFTLGRIVGPEQHTGPFELASSKLGALPVIDHFLARMDLEQALGRHLPVGDTRTSIPASTVIGVLVRNLCVERKPLYGLAGWAGAFEPGLLGLGRGELSWS
jgi:hypothetical protein